MSGRTHPLAAAAHRPLPAPPGTGCRLEDIDEKAVVLAETANKFKNTSGSLKRNMQWKYIRMVILMTVLVAAVLTIIIVPLVITSKK